jgi:glycerol-3-phosphate dehydrogenase (NAD+)
MLSGNVIFNKWIEVTSDSTNVTSLVDIINDTHENVKYLKGIKLPSNIIATSDIVKAVEDADVLIFVVPHEFVDQTLAQMKGHCKDTCVVVSLTKGLHVSKEGPKLLSDVIAKELGIKSTAVLMGGIISKFQISILLILIIHSKLRRRSS